MNLLQVQDDLKNFSQDQLVKEMQQPSGSTPQFLVLSELNRRKRVKGDFEARQAKQQPTVAQDVVASAGVPQQGMMGMSEAMAPASVDSGGIGAMMPQNMKSGGVIRAQDGLPNNKYRPFDEFPEYPEGYEYTPEDTRLDRIFKGTGQIIHDVKPYLPFHPEFMKVIGNDAYQFFNQPVGEVEAEKEEIEDAKNIDQAVNDATIKATTKPKTEKKDETKPLTLEEELIKRQAGLDKDRNFDKYMALAQAGLGILASDKPTLGQAVGEGGMKGLDAFNAANKRYQEGLTDILNARVKLKAAKKTGLSQKDAITAISSIDSDIAKLDENLTKEYDESRKSQILAKIAQLNFQKRGLMPLAGYSYLPQDVSDSANTKS